MGYTMFTVTITNFCKHKNQKSTSFAGSMVGVHYGLFGCKLLDDSV